MDGRYGRQDRGAPSSRAVTTSAAGRAAAVGSPPRTWRTPTATRSGRTRHVLSPVRYRSAGLAYLTGLWQAAVVVVPVVLALAAAGVDGGATPWGVLAVVAGVGAVMGLSVPLARLRLVHVRIGSVTPLLVRWCAWVGGASIVVLAVIVRWAALS
ncbi:hypothetical protein [Cellulosimicrobium protaetiae]|uniref:Uncharacterized protein n=1 Tax=Cellulosimicrobium protaetiae TaxID=2587808 RepID=A0A6M5UHE2_9MICO|nr:hypothetical protein [Cellulosimicrobium protaetiae]QJW36992.1 hypothetical protein FIC82_013170 [Cellulosimicrobium protaetiae]